MAHDNEKARVGVIIAGYYYYEICYNAFDLFCVPVVFHEQLCPMEKL